MKPPLNDSDEDLLRLLGQGNQKAFEAIYFRYVKGLTAYALKRISNKDDCFEIIQDVFESIWTRRAQLAHVTILEAYLFRMVKYKIIRYFQHNQIVKRYQDHFKAFQSMVEEISEDGEEFENLRAVINRSMEGLPDRCQTALRLRLDENLSNGDIAKRMNIDKATVKRYMTSAMNYFRKVHSPLYKSQ